MDVIYLLKNRERKNKAESRNGINDAVRNRILYFHAVLNLKLKLCDYVVVSLEHGKVRIHHFQSRRICEVLGNCISVNFTPHSGRCQGFFNFVNRKLFQQLRIYKTFAQANT